VSFFPDLPSADLNEIKHELNRYAILSYQGTNGASLTYQAALFTHYSSVQYSPDPIGDLMYRGIAPTVQRSTVTNGVQFDASLDRWKRHTVGVGLSVSTQHTDSDNTSLVFPADSSGTQIPGAPFTVFDATALTTKLAGVYVQDSWRATESLTVNYGLRFDYFDGLTRSGSSARASGLSQLGRAYDLARCIRQLLQSTQARICRTRYDREVCQHHRPARGARVLARGARANAILRRWHHPPAFAGFESWTRRLR
jgi:outer membrane receptor protein involved in Fe transport